MPAPLMKMMRPVSVEMMPMPEPKVYREPVHKTYTMGGSSSKMGGHATMKMGGMKTFHTSQADRP